jgi:MtrB/PioB family decaheme-associated outer membrane protein
MRTRAIVIGAFLLTSAGLVEAQDTQQQTASQTASQVVPKPGPTVTPAPATPFVPKFGFVDFGYRGDSLSGDEARYNRFRDTRDGATVNNLRFARETDTTYFRGEVFNMGYRDQRYFGEFQSIGKVKANFEWNQVPLFLSKDTQSLYTDTGNGVLTIADNIQTALQAAGTTAAIRDPILDAALASSAFLDLRSRRDLGTFNLVYSMSRDVDLKFKVRNAHRTGNQVMAYGFGTSPGLNPAVEFGAPLDDRTTDVKGALEFANTKGLLSVGYDGSWYENSIPLIKFDNPLRATDISAGPSAGQAGWWPSNSAYSINVNGSYKLAKRTRASAAVSFGNWTQDQPLPPPTVNTALVAPPLERTTAATEADITSMVFGFSSRPVEALTLTARYRYYDYDNKTPHFTATNAIIGDWAAGTQIHETEPSSFKRQNLDLDAQFSPFRYVGVGVGYGREDGERTYRIYGKTADDVFRFTVDALGNQYVNLRFKYEFSERVGSEFDEHLLDEVGEQPEMRHYDIANRDRNRYTTLVTISPAAFLSFTGSYGFGDDDYQDSGFGLRDAENNNWSLGFDAAPTQAISFGLSYGYDKFTAFDYHRTANPLSATDVTFLDPRRDWWNDQTDTVKTTTVYADMAKLLPKTDVRASYDFSDGDATYVYGKPDDNPAFQPIGTTPFIQLPPLKNQSTVGRFDVDHFVRPNVAIGVSYLYEEYKVDDFSLDTDTINSLAPKSAASGAFASTIYAGYLFRPYTAHTWWLRMKYLW